MTSEFYVCNNGDFVNNIVYTIRLPKVITTTRERNFDILHIIDLWLENFYHTKLRPVSCTIFRYMSNDRNVLEFIHKLMMNFIGIELIDMKIRHYIVHQVRLDPRIDQEDFWMYKNRFPKLLTKFRKLLQRKNKN